MTLPFTPVVAGSVLAESDLTVEQLRWLIVTPALWRETHAELLDTDLSVLDDLTTDLRVDGDVHWAQDATVHGDAEFAIARELDWGVALVRLFEIRVDLITGLTARFDLGVYCTHTPDQVLGELVDNLGGTDQEGDQVLVWSVSGQDRLYKLDRQVGRSYVIPAGTNALTALAAVFTAAGALGVLIDGAASSKTVPTTMTWPLIPGTVVGGQGDGSTASTWLDIVNALCGLLNYDPAYVDRTGYYRCGPHVDPDQQTTAFLFDASDPMTSTVGPARTRTLDQYGAPNKLIATQDNLGSGVPPVAGAGLVIVVNQSDGPSSIDGRGGEVWPVQESFTAADQATLQALAESRMAELIRATATFQIVTAPFPCFEPYAVHQYREDRFGTVTVQPSEWRYDLAGGLTTWNLTQIGVGQ